VGLDGAKLVQRTGLVPTCLLLSGQIERLVGVLPGLLALSLETADFTEPYEPDGMPEQRARVDAFADRLLPVAPALGEGPKRAQGPRQTRSALDACTGGVRLPVHSLDVPPQQFGCPDEVADGPV
jgi:hypothetical protein